MTLVRDHNPESLALADGASVPAWADDQGSGIPLVQATSGNQPTMATSGQKINGLKAIHFDGVDDLMATAPFTAITQPLTIFIVCRMTAGTYSYVSLNPVIVFGNVSTLEVFGIRTAGRLEYGLHVYAIHYDGVSSRFFVDGQERLAADFGATSLTRISFGGNDADSSIFYTAADLGRIKVFSGSMTPAEIKTESDALAATYGITSLSSQASVSRTIVTGTSGTTSQDYEIVVPTTYSPGTPAPLLFFYGGGGQDFNSISSDGQLVRVIDAFLAKGFIVSCSHGHGNDQHGSNTVIADYDDLYAIITGAYSIDTTRIFIAGQSVGGDTSALLASGFSVNIPHPLGWLGIYPMVSLDYAFNSSFNAGVVNAYGITGTTPNTYAELTAGHDPCLVSASKYAGMYMRAYHSPDDATVPKANNSDVLHTLAASTAAEFTVVSTTGVHGDDSNFNYGDVYDFLGRSETDTTPPTVTGSSNIDITGLLATIYLSEAGAGVDDAVTNGDFTVSGGHVLSVGTGSEDGIQWVENVTLVYKAQTVSLSYVNNHRVVDDPAGNELATFGPLTLVNNSTVICAVPANLAVTPYNGKLRISWTGNSEPVLKDYKVYTSDAVNGTYTLATGGTVLAGMNTLLLTSTNDTEVFVKITSRDTADNESLKSSAVSTTPTAASGEEPSGNPAALFASFGSGFGF